MEYGALYTDAGNVCAYWLVCIDRMLLDEYRCRHTDTHCVPYNYMSSCCPYDVFLTCWCQMSWFVSCRLVKVTCVCKYAGNGRRKLLRMALKQLSLGWRQSVCFDVWLALSVPACCLMIQIPKDNSSGMYPPSHELIFISLALVLAELAYIFMLFII